MGKVREEWLARGRYRARDEFNQVLTGIAIKEATSAIGVSLFPLHFEGSRGRALIFCPR